MKLPTLRRHPQARLRAAQQVLSPRQNSWWWITASALAIIIFSISVPMSATIYQVPVLAAFAVGLLQCGSIPFSIVAPRWSIVSWVAGAIVFFALSVPDSNAPWPLDVPGLLSLCALLVSLGLRRPVIEGVLSWALSVAASVIVLFYVGASPEMAQSVNGVIANVVTVTAITAAVLLVAILLAQRGTMSGELATEQERRVMVEERNRIARELHDVVAHSMSVIQVQASSAPYRLPNLEDDARQEFGEIAASARAAMKEMRQLLGVLRSEDSNAPGVPQQGVAQIVDLVASLERAGSVISVDISPALPADGLASSAAYRIAQESLSNVVRHAPGARVRVFAELVDGAIMICVENEAPADPPATHAKGGHGLVGMRERTAILGGQLYAGPTSDGGYRVLATLPIAPRSLPADRTPDAASASNDKDLQLP